VSTPVGKDESVIRPVATAAAAVARPAELAVIVPTFNERGNVEELIRQLTTALRGIDWEVIFVDDDSPDGTAALVRSISARLPHVRVVHRIGRKGLSSAVIEGILATSAPYLAVIDGDLQHDAGLLPDMLAKARTGEADIVVGSRYMDGGGFGDWTRGRQRISQWATRIAARLLPVPVSDPMSGFFMVTRPVFESAVHDLSGVGFKILLDIVLSAPPATRVRELPYTFQARRHGESKLDSLVAWQFLTMILDKKIGHIVPAKFVIFGVVGGFGLLLHLAALWVALNLGGLVFSAAQSVATLVAMTSNYFLNNAFTHRDRRRTGWRLWTGLLSFYAICLVGAAANVGIASVIYEHEPNWWLSGIAGALMSSVWNFAVSSIYTWRK
jgi:dolichol-phosphate mannosyltransferase